MRPQFSGQKLMLRPETVAQQTTDEQLHPVWL